MHRGRSAALLVAAVFLLSFWANMIPVDSAIVGPGDTAYSAIAVEVLDLRSLAVSLFRTACDCYADIATIFLERPMPPSDIAAIPSVFLDGGAITSFGLALSGTVVVNTSTTTSEFGAVGRHRCFFAFNVAKMRWLDPEQPFQSDSCAGCSIHVLRAVSAAATDRTGGASQQQPVLLAVASSRNETTGQIVNGTSVTILEFVLPLSNSDSGASGSWRETTLLPPLSSSAASNTTLPTTTAAVTSLDALGSCGVVTGLFRNDTGTLWFLQYAADVGAASQRIWQAARGPQILGKQIPLSDAVCLSDSVVAVAGQFAWPGDPPQGPFRGLAVFDIASGEWAVADSPPIGFCSRLTRSTAALAAAVVGGVRSASLAAFAGCSTDGFGANTSSIYSVVVGQPDEIIAAKIATADGVVLGIAPAQVPASAFLLRVGQHTALEDERLYFVDTSARVVKKLAKLLSRGLFLLAGPDPAPSAACRCKRGPNPHPDPDPGGEDPGGAGRPTWFVPVVVSAAVAGSVFMIGVGAAVLHRRWRRQDASMTMTITPDGQPMRRHRADRREEAGSPLLAPRSS